jgi:hypothetical protein
VFDWLWLVAWCAASTAWCIGAARELGATCDEPIYVCRGLKCWRTGSHHGLLELGTMPLPVDVATLPLYLWERLRGVRLNAAVDLDHLLPAARAGTLVFWWLLLFYGWRTGRDIAGPWGGRVSVAFLAIEPSMLAHASLASTDIAVSACLLAFVYHYRASREHQRELGWLRRVGVPSFWFGACVLAKASGLVFGPLCMFAVELEHLLRRHELVPPTSDASWLTCLRALWSAWQPWRRHCRHIIGLGLILVFVYCGCDWEPHIPLVNRARSLPPSPVNQELLWVAEHLRIFSNAGEGLVKQVIHNCRGHGVYLLGHTARALWYYFPVALTIKLSIPLLLLPFVLLIVRPRALLNWASAAAAILLVFSLTYRVQIGVRLVLPLAALGIAGLSGSLVNAWQQARMPSIRRLLIAATAACVASTAIAAIRVYPEALCYTNPLWGGTAQGYRLLSDSNYDWGQGLAELSRWEAEHGIDNLDVWYMGSDPAIKTLHSMPLQDLPLRTPEDLIATERGRYLAASTTMVYGSYEGTDSHRMAAAYLRNTTPAARTQTYLIYDFTQVPPSFGARGASVSTPEQPAE